MISSGVKNPVFSIITPTFRRPEMLVRNIKSVLNQTFSDFEHIIIDDANDPETLQVVSKFDESRIVFINHFENKGTAAAYNTGIKISRGRYVLFLDDDDEYLPDILEKIYIYFSSEFTKNIGFIWTGISRLRDIGNKEILLQSFVWPHFFKNLEEGIIAATSISNVFGVCIRRECFDEIGLYDETVIFGEDTEFLFRLSKRYSFCTIPEVLVKVHQHCQNQLTGKKNILKRIRGQEQIFTRNSDLFKKFPKLIVVHYNSYAHLCYRAGQKVKARNTMFLLLKTRPFRILTYLDFVSFELVGTNFGDTVLGKILKFLSYRRALNYGN